MVKKELSTKLVLTIWKTFNQGCGDSPNQTLWGPMVKRESRASMATIWNVRAIGHPCHIDQKFPTDSKLTWETNKHANVSLKMVSTTFIKYWPKLANKQHIQSWSTIPLSHKLFQNQTWWKGFSIQDTYFSKQQWHYLK